MLAISAALIRRLLPQLSEDPPRTGGLRTWMENGSFYVALGVAADDLVLQSVNLTELVPFISFDYERFAFSSLESLLSCTAEPANPKAISWSAAKLYYSAFFGAHAIMRATGKAVTRVEALQAARVSKVTSLYVPSAKLATGTYYCRLSQTPTMSLDLNLTKQQDVGGAHEQFWKSFYRFIAELAAEVGANNEPEAMAVVAEASEIQDVLASSGMNGGTWLSFIRNQFTYQHTFGVWFPFQKSDPRAVDYIRQIQLRDSSSIRRDYSCSKEPLLAFFANCHLIATISYDLATALCQGGNMRRFQQLWDRLESDRETS